MPPRPHQVSRFEEFSDARSGGFCSRLALSLETPWTGADPWGRARGPLFLALMLPRARRIRGHSKFFRRYGLQDALRAFPHVSLLVVALLDVYPICNLTTRLWRPGFPSRTPASKEQAPVPVLARPVRSLTFGTLVRRPRPVWSQRQNPGLSPVEEGSLRVGPRAPAAPGRAA
jgi:hypothetical protein